jgi:DNA modification methylase
MQFSKPGDVIFDPFSGSGVVPLESLLCGRGVIANDINPYAAVLTQAKIFPPRSPVEAERISLHYIQQAKNEARMRRYRVSAPSWVRRFFHRRTLAEAKLLADVLLRNKEWFILANLLGILHHQRPGFLSFPSSHLVPYLRIRKFPRARHPELYRYRDLEPRLIAKLRRSFKVGSSIDTRLPRTFTAENIVRLDQRRCANLALTSPPYMNALDYGRDNRLRLWFVGVDDFRALDQLSPRNPAQFHSLMCALAHLLDRAVLPLGTAVLIVGEVRRRRPVVNTSEIVRTAFEKDRGRWSLTELIADEVPDIRRSRRGCLGTKQEWIMVFRKR